MEGQGSLQAHLKGYGPSYYGGDLSGFSPLLCSDFATSVIHL